MAEKSSTGITEQLVSLGFETDRLKTGTPPRIDGRSLDYSKMEEQKGDENPNRFSFIPSAKGEASIYGNKEQMSCQCPSTSTRSFEAARAPIVMGGRLALRTWTASAAASRVSTSMVWPGLR